MIRSMLLSGTALATGVVWIPGKREVLVNPGETIEQWKAREQRINPWWRAAR